MQNKIGLSAALYPCILFLFWLISGCTKLEEKPIRLLAIQGEDVSSFKLILNTFQALDSTGYIHIPVQDGDLISVDDFSLFIREDLADTLIIRNEDSLLFVNKKLWGIDLREFNDLQYFKNNSKGIDFSHLKTLIIGFPLGNNEKIFLEDISNLKSRIDFRILNFDSLGHFNDDLKWLTSRFQPQHLLFDKTPDYLDFKIIQSIKTLEFLGLGTFPKSLQQGILPPFPQIKSLFLHSEDDSFLNFDFFSKNTQLERLIAWYFLGTEIHVLKNLKELSLFYPLEYFPTYDFALRHPHLENLDFPNLYFNNFDGLKGLDRLKWLSFIYSGDSLGLDLGELAKIQPQLKLLSLSQGEIGSMLANHSALRDFPQLEYLLVKEELYGIDSIIMKMPYLKYLSMPEEYLKDSTNLEALQKALPNTIISSNSGLCLGSGWLLALVPLSFLAFLFQKSFFSISLGKNEG